MYSYRLSFEAEEDVVRIFEFGLARFGLQQAKIYYDMLFECFTQLRKEFLRKAPQMSPDFAEFF